jgi:hypothetical protein
MSIGNRLVPRTAAHGSADTLRHCNDYLLEELEFLSRLQANSLRTSLQLAVTVAVAATALKQQLVSRRLLIGGELKSDYRSSLEVIEVRGHACSQQQSNLTA